MEEEKGVITPATVPGPETLGQMPAPYSPERPQITTMSKPSKPRFSKRLIVLLVVLAVLVGGGYFWWQAGFTFDISRFFAVDVGVMTVQCGFTQNVITWTYDSRANSNSIQRGNDGPKNLPDCADYWCWLPRNNFPHQVPTPGNPATYTDTQLQQGVCYEYRIKYQPLLPSNSIFCPTNCNVFGTVTPTPTLTRTVTPTPPLFRPTVDLQCNGTDGPCIVQSGSQATLSWSSTRATSCAASGDWSGDKAVPSGSEATGALLTDATYTLVCTGPGGLASDTVDVNVVTTAVALTCSTQTKSVQSGETVTLTGAGGVRGYFWSAPDGNPASGRGSTFQTSFIHIGLPETQVFDVTVSDASENEATCQISVQCQAPTCAAPAVGCFYEEANACGCGTLVCPTATATATATPVELSCAPASQTVQEGEVAALQASGGSGVYSWSSPNGNAQSTSSAAEYRVTYDQAGGYTVTVSDGQGAFDQCVVTVTSVAVSPTPTATPTPVPGQAFLQVSKTVRNISRGTAEAESTPASPGETVQFLITIRAMGSVTARNVVIRDQLPTGLTYRVGTALPTGAESIFGGGFFIGLLAPNDERTITFQALVGDGSASGTTDVQNIAIAEALNATSRFIDGAIVIIVGPTATVIPPVAEIPTGPGQATVLALVISAIVTLLYVGYTSTDAFRRREASGYARDDRRHPTFHR